MELSTDSFQSLKDSFNENTLLIQGVLESIDESEFFKNPINGGWCVGEITEHLLISDRTGLFAIVRKNLPTDRNPLEILKLLEERRSQSEMKIEAPEAAKPKGVFKSKQEAVNAWKNNRLTVLEKVNTNNIWMLAAGFEHPKLGMMTVAEWMLFMCWHGEHHLPQIKSCAGI